MPLDLHRYFLTDPPIPTTATGSTITGGRYRSPRYWAGRYWPQRWGSGPQGEPFPEDLLGALGQLFDKAGLASVASGGYWSKEAGRLVSMPYVIGSERTAGVEYRSSTAQIDKVTITIRVYAEDLDQAGRIGDTIRPAFKGKTLRWRGGYAMPLVVTEPGRHERMPGYTRSGSEAWAWTIGFDARVNREV